MPAEDCTCDGCVQDRRYKEGAAARMLVDIPLEFNISDDRASAHGYVLFGDANSSNSIQDKIPAAMQIEFASSYFYKVQYELPLLSASNEFIWNDELRGLVNFSIAELARRDDNAGAAYVKNKIFTGYYTNWQSPTGARLLTGSQFPEEMVGRLAQWTWDHFKAIAPMCTECNMRHLENEEHIECFGCEWTGIEAEFAWIEAQHQSGTTETISLCNDCSGEEPEDLTGRVGYYRRCIRCELYMHVSRAYWVGDTDGSVEEGWYCGGDFEDYVGRCQSCSTMGDPDTLIYMESTDSVVCAGCYEDQPRVGEINNYSYTPDLVFHPEIPADVKQPLYIGMEIEVSCKQKSYAPWDTFTTAWRHSLTEEWGDLIYHKEDSSVNNGWEIVTHPMQPDWALENFPFKQFGDAAVFLEETHHSTGTHVHVNKEAFSANHLWKFMQFHFRLKEFCGLVGGRGTNANYGALESQSSNRQREDLMKIVKKKEKTRDYDRSIGLNLRNEYTIEMRYMRGGPRPAEIKKNIQWVKALYEFTGKLTVREVRDGVIDDPGYFIWWLKQSPEKWMELIDWINARIPQPKAMPTYEEAN